MAAQAPCIIEVAVNGVTKKTRNPLAPEAPEEIAEQAIDSLDAGASIVHMHTSEGGLPFTEAAALYAKSLRIMRAARPDAVLYPTMGSGTTIEDRYDHHRLLVDEGLIDMGVIDPGSVNLAGSTPDGPPTGTYVYVNSPADINYMMRLCQETGIGPSFAIYEPGFLRMVLIYHATGQLAPRSLTKFYFSGEGYFGGGMPTFSAPPIVEALDLYCAMLGDADLPWGSTVLGGSILDTPIARLTVERGGHLRVGLEDFGNGPSNVEQVQRAVALCEEVGRPVATNAQAREILGMPAH
jgi:3-keto-5-aminohexanoate cleavage enzyme